MDDLDEPYASADYDEGWDAPDRYYGLSFLEGSVHLPVVERLQHHVGYMNADTPYETCTGAENMAQEISTHFPTNIIVVWSCYYDYESDTNASNQCGERDESFWLNGEEIEDPCPLTTK